jgi:hypothetical protein
LLRDEKQKNYTDDKKIPQGLSLSRMINHRFGIPSGMPPTTEIANLRLALLRK